MKIMRLQAIRENLYAENYIVLFFKVGHKTEIWRLSHIVLSQEKYFSAKKGKIAE